MLTYSLDVVSEPRLLEPRTVFRPLLIVTVALLSAGCVARTRSGGTSGSEPALRKLVPSDWLDLPDAPFVVQLRTVKGRQTAVLVNRTRESYRGIVTGCVVQREGRARVVGQLLGSITLDGSVAPGQYYDVFEGLAEFVQTTRRCPAESSSGLIEATTASGRQWTAEGTRWPRK